MSTWHQQQTPVQLWHATLYTVVNDPPDRPMTVDRYKDPVAAQQACDRINAREQGTAYVLPPQ